MNWETISCAMVFPYESSCSIIVNLSAQQWKAKGLLQRCHHLPVLTLLYLVVNVSLEIQNHSFYYFILLCVFLAFSTHPSP